MNEQLDLNHFSFLDIVIFSFYLAIVFNVVYLGILSTDLCLLLILLLLPSRYFYFLHRFYVFVYDYFLLNPPIYSVF